MSSRRAGRSFSKKSSGSSQNSYRIRGALIRGIRGAKDRLRIRGAVLRGIRGARDRLRIRGAVLSGIRGAQDRLRIRGAFSAASGARSGRELRHPGRSGQVEDPGAGRQDPGRDS